jgi:hypothetical protein
MGLAPAWGYLNLDAMRAVLSAKPLKVNANAFPCQTITQQNTGNLSSIQND